MFNHRTMAVIKREVNAQMMTKAFIFITILMPAIMFGFMFIQGFVMTYESKDKVNLSIYDQSGVLINSIEAELNEREFVKDGQYQISYMDQRDGTIEEVLEGLRGDIINKKITGIIYIPDSAKVDKQLYYYSANPGNRDIMGDMRGVINKVLLKQYFEDKDVSDNDIRFAQRRVGFDGVRVSESGIEKDALADKIIAFAFTFLLFLSIVMIGQSLMMSVTEEKTNRVVEILLSSLRPSELMTGKVIGTTATGLAQMMIWTLPVILLGAGSLSAFADIEIQLSAGHALYFFANYLIGLITYLCLYAAFGAIFDNPQDAQQGIWPLMMLIMIPFYTAFTLIKNPDNIISTVSSMLPFTSIMVMPARSALMDVPFWQIAVALAVNLLVLFVILKVVAKVYKIAILTTGKKPSWKEIGQWVKYD